MIIDANLVEISFFILNVLKNIIMITKEIRIKALFVFCK
jgi:hypothetical protein